MQDYCWGGGGAYDKAVTPLRPSLHEQGKNTETLKKNSAVAMILILDKVGKDNRKAPKYKNLKI